LLIQFPLLGILKLQPFLDRSMGSDDNDISDHPLTDDSIAEYKRRAYYALFLLMGFTPVVIFMIMPFWERYWKMRRMRETAKRRLVSTKLAEPIREAYLRELMKDYSMVLSKSDFCIGSESNEKEESVDGTETAEAVLTPVIELCCTTLLSTSSCDIHDPTTDKVDNDCSGNPSPMIDIEMQIEKINVSDEEEEGEEEEEEIDDTCDLECDNDECQHPTIYIPIPGQKILKLTVDDQMEGTEHASTILPAASEALFVSKNKAHSDGCAICMNSFGAGQKITWSSNSECGHVFHHECLLEWFMSVGKMAWKAKIRRQERLGWEDKDTATIRKEICDFPKLCPFCRRDYFLNGSQEAAVVAAAAVEEAISSSDVENEEV